MAGPEAKLGWRQKFGRPAAAALLVLAGACVHTPAPDSEEFVGAGYVSASSEPPPGLFAPVLRGDVEATAERGRLLAAMERCLALATAEMSRVGLAPGDVVLPIVDVDPGLRSGQVLFVRGSSAAGQEGLQATTAERWLMVSLLLAPEQVVDVELLSGGALDPESALAERVDRLLAAARTLYATGQSFHLFSLQEQLADEKPGAGKRVVTRVYALAADPSGPDYELVVERPRRAKTPEVTRSTLIHAAGTFARDPVTLELPAPAPATVTRVLQRPAQARDVLVQNTAGLRWSISTRDGRISRMTEAEGSY